MFNNQLQIIGNLTKDAEVKESKSGKKFLSFTVAVNEGKDKPAIFVEVFDSIRDESKGHPLQQYLTKGTKVFCQGRMQPGGYYSEQKKDYIPTTTLWLTACEPIRSTENTQVDNPPTTQEKVAVIFPDRSNGDNGAKQEIVAVEEGTDLPF